LSSSYQPVVYRQIHLGVQCAEIRELGFIRWRKIPMNPKSPRIFVALIILLFGCFTTIWAQTAATPPRPSPTATPAPVVTVSPPPEQKAYDEARRIKDPEKKIEALEKIVKDFPDRFQAFQARSEGSGYIDQEFSNSNRANQNRR
jgi:hypothetical protein